MCRRPRPHAWYHFCCGEATVGGRFQPEANLWQDLALVSLTPYPSHQKSCVYLLLNQHCVALIRKSRTTKTFPRSTFSPKPPNGQGNNTNKSWWLSSKASTCNAGDEGLIPGSGRYPGEGNDNPLQYSCLGNPMDRGTRGLQSMVLQSWTRLTDLTAASASPSGHRHPDFKLEEPIKTQAPQPC